MEEGTVTDWHVADGDHVQAGQVLYTLETDKVTNDVESPLSGVIKLVAEVGETYAVGDIVAELEH